jgi:OOP family OmpA-OmpF porin
MSAQQNLVPNGSFEDTVHCPQGGGAEIYLSKFFSSPTDATPDYFNVCALPSNFTSIPSNLGGYQYAHSGNAYGGIVCYGFGSNYKEYIQTSLSSTLEKDKFYLIEYYVSLGNISPLSCNNFGAIFSQTSIYQNNFTTLNYPTALNSNNVVNDTLNWIKISYYYAANGDENYLIIGNFLEDELTDTLSSGIGGAGDVYYYVDDISVTRIDYQIPNVFTPNSDLINDVWRCDFSAFNIVNCAIYNRWGNLIFQSNKQIILWDGTTKSGNNCEDGVYFYCIETEKEKYKGHILLIR